MNAGELFKAGRLGEALEAQLGEVKAHPTDQGKRLFLFELLAFSGELDRAARQLDAIHYDETELEMAIQLYRKLIDSERARRQLFENGISPEFHGEPSKHLRLRLQAVNALRANQPTEALELLGQADEATPAFSGTLNGQPFEMLRDADDLFSGVLEVMVHGRYIWIGLEQLDTLDIEAPKFPRDLIYLPAMLGIGEQVGPVFLPTLYPNSQQHEDEAVKLGRASDWNSIEDGPTLGLGPHTFLCDEDSFVLLEWRAYRSARAGSEATMIPES